MLPAGLYIDILMRYAFMLPLQLQDGSAVAMTETVQGTYRVDLSSLQTLGRVRDSWRGRCT